MWEGRVGPSRRRVGGVSQSIWHCCSVAKLGVGVVDKSKRNSEGRNGLKGDNFISYWGGGCGVIGRVGCV